MSRHMELTYGDTTIYESSFDPETGDLVRQVEMKSHKNALDASNGELPRSNETPEDLPWQRQRHAWSPVPETVDVKITDRCPVGCAYCYMDSTKDSPHGPSDLIDTIIEGFDQPPYEMAIGGGEPTLHPDFPEILRRCREEEVVPSYTTAGVNLDDEVLEATNEYVGGVAMSYHPHLGLEWFEERFQALQEALTVPLHVHLVATEDVVEHFHDLMDIHEDHGPFEIVLLGYYPQGRGEYDQIMSKETYSRDLPLAIEQAQERDIGLSFSESMLPYFLSRPELGLNLDFAMRSEGYFSCYVDMEGRMSYSSFAEEGAKSNKTVYEKSSQELWANLKTPYDAEGKNCRNCKQNAVCSQPDFTHYLQCAYSEVNGGEEKMKEDGNLYVGRSVL